MNGNTVNDIYTTWQKGEANLTYYTKEIYEEFEGFMKDRLEVINNLIDDNEWKAFGEVNTLFSFVNLSASLYNPILKKLEGLVYLIKDLLDKLARKLKAVGYSIGVGAPVGISFSLSYSI